MNTDPPIQTLRRGRMRLQLFEETDPEKVIRALEKPGEVLQNTRKRAVRRVDDWVIKASRFNRGSGVVKHTFRRDRYRIGWRASVALFQRGVPVPRPRAFIEHGVFPIITGNTLISDYLHDCVDVKSWAEQHVEDERGPSPADFFAGLGDAINAFHGAGAYHQDLKTDNILTPDGESFYFIDLDDVVLDRPCPDSIRLKNHVQLYYGFSEIFPEETLLDFVSSMKPQGIPAEQWHKDVLQGHHDWVERKKRIHAKLGIS
jgi:Lipopolysaccharide kinase (Kdo/WaaP) family